MLCIKRLKIAVFTQTFLLSSQFYFYITASSKLIPSDKTTHDKTIIHNVCLEKELLQFALTNFTQWHQSMQYVTAARNAIQ
jgi:hypothetical protein